MASCTNLTFTTRLVRQTSWKNNQRIKDGCIRERWILAEHVARRPKRTRSGLRMNTRRAQLLPNLSFVVESAGKLEDLNLFGIIYSARIRRPLATSQYLVEHKPREATTASHKQQNGKAAPTGSCAHYFVDPLSWMRPELEQGKLDGRLECPKCKTNVGKYAWQGMRCSCGDWVVPGLSLAKGRIDEVKSRTSASASMGIRMPPSTPGRKPGPGQQNL